MPQNFDTLSASNPYRKNIDNYQPSFLQKLWMSLGGRTQYDAWRENMQVQADEYDAALAQKQFDTEYNDPQSQVARMKAAGLNPDIDPGSIDSGSAAPMGEDPSTPMQSTGEETQLLQFGQAVISAAMNGLSIVQSVQGIQRGHLENVLAGLRNDTEVREKSKDIFMDALPEAPTDDRMMDAFDWKSNTMANARGLVKGFSKKQQRSMLGYIEQYLQNGPMQGEAYESFANRVKNRKSYYDESTMFYSEWDSIMSDIYEELNGLSEDIFKAKQHASLDSAKAESAESQYKEDYFDNLDGGDIAAAQNDTARTTLKQNEFTRTNLAMQQMLRARLKNMMDKIEAKSHQKGMPGTLASGVLGFLSLLELAVSSGQFSLGKML